MQPHRYFNELDHWRNISQRPHPTSPPLSPSLNPNTTTTTTTTTMPKEESKPTSTTDPFAVEGSRGWLEYGAPVTEKSTKIKRTSESSSDSSNSNNNSISSHHISEGAKSRMKASASSSKTTKKADKPSNNANDSQQQKKAKELLEVSNEDILNLTKMTAHLPDRTGSTTGGNNSSAHKKQHHHHQRMETKKQRSFASAEHLPTTISTSGLNNNSNNNNNNNTNNTSYPSPTRPSVSTPSPSNRNASNNEKRRSWYKHWMKRDKGKSRETTADNNETSVLMVRDGSHQSSSNNSSNMTTTTAPPMTTKTTGSDGGGVESNVITDPTKQFMSAHHHPISAAFPVNESRSDDGHHHNRKISISSPIKLERAATEKHRRTSSAAPHMTELASSSSPNKNNDKKPKKYQFQRRHSLDSVQTPEDIPSFSTPEIISNGHNNNILASDVLHHDDMDLSDDNNDLRKSEDIGSNRSSLAFGITSEEEEERGEYQQQQQQQQEEEKRIMLDYDTLPPEVLGLLREYEKQGKIQIEERRVKMYYKNDDEEEEEEEEEEGDDDAGLVDVSELVSTVAAPYDNREGGMDDNDSIMTKKIVTVRASRSDRVEFVKLVHLTDGHSMKNGYLLDLHVSMLGDEIEDEEINRPEEMQMLLGRVDRRIEALQKVTQDAKQFMNDNKQAMDALTFDDEAHELSNSPWPSPANSNGRQTSNTSIHSIKEAAAAAAAAKKEEEEIKKRPSAFSLHTQSSSSTTTATLSSTVSASPLSTRPQQKRPSSSIRRAPSSLLLDPHASDPHLPYNSVNPFDYRQEEVRLGVSALENEMAEFKCELQVTEELIRDIQMDISDTRGRMSSYIKDIPEAHYSALKKLEVDVESILANRAKNPWIDTGYTILSYLLTLFALLVWIIICGLKWGRTVILFPRKLWRTYTEYLVERDRAVKRASLRSVASGSRHHVDPNSPPSPTLLPLQPPSSLTSPSHSHPHRSNINNDTPSSSFTGVSSSSSSSSTINHSSSISSQPKNRIVHHHNHHQ